MRYELTKNHARAKKAACGDGPFSYLTQAHIHPGMC